MASIVRRCPSLVILLKMPGGRSSHIGTCPQSVPARIIRWMASACSLKRPPRVGWGELSRTSPSPARRFETVAEAEGLVDELVALGHQRVEVVPHPDGTGLAVRRGFFRWIDVGTEDVPVWTVSCPDDELVQVDDGVPLFGEIESLFPSRHAPGHPHVLLARLWRQSHPLFIRLERLRFETELNADGSDVQVAVVKVIRIGSAPDEVLLVDTVWPRHAIDDPEDLETWFPDSLVADPDCRFSVDEDDAIEACAMLAEDESVAVVDLPAYPFFDPSIFTHPFLVSSEVYVPDDEDDPEFVRAHALLGVYDRAIEAGSALLALRLMRTEEPPGVPQSVLVERLSLDPDATVETLGTKLRSAISDLVPDEHCPWSLSLFAGEMFWSCAEEVDPVIDALESRVEDLNTQIAGYDRPEDLERLREDRRNAADTPFSLSDLTRSMLERSLGPEGAIFSPDALRRRGWVQGETSTWYPFAGSG